MLNRLNALGIAIWYMDDGGLSQKKRNGVVHANELMLNTGLSKENNQIIIVDESFMDFVPKDGRFSLMDKPF